MVLGELLRRKSARLSLGSTTDRTIRYGWSPPNFTHVAGKIEINDLLEEEENISEENNLNIQIDTYTRIRDAPLSLQRDKEYGNLVVLL
jgi:hypothetical protein